MAEVRKFRWGYEGSQFHNKEFMNYLGGLSKDAPFSCDNLRVLPEEVHLVRKGAPSKKYPAGTLLCLYRVRNGLSQRCHIDSDVTVNEEGKLEVKCGQNVRLNLGEQK